MSFVKKHILPKCANIIGTPRLIRKSNQNMINVFYHSVSNEYLPHISPLYKLKSIAEFENDIDFILKHFNPVSINEIQQIVAENKIFSKPSFHISFDDGLREVYTNVLPILKAKGIPATVFVNSNFVGNRNLFYRYKVALLIDRLKNAGVSESKNKEISNVSR